eukprot:g73513.t1
MKTSRGVLTRECSGSCTKMASKNEKPFDKQEKDGGKKDKESLSQMPVRAYLDKTVTPILMEGLVDLAKERPEKPILWLAQWLLKKSEEPP